ncbi:hypothetical protein SUGI_0229530 [Cryptomeria japonica]|nr:hypothetical protein SUGI_0229530 [Cryptomeria japonica]
MAMYQDFYVSNDGYAMQDGTPWIGNNPQDHPGMIQVLLGHIRALDIIGYELLCLVYVSREKRPGFQHHKRAGAMNALSKQEKRLEGSTSSESEWTSFIQSGSEFLEFVNKHIQLEMGDEGNREVVAQILQSVEKVHQMVGGLSLVAFLLDQIEEIPENRSEYIELLRQMFKLARYIRRMKFLKAFVNHEGLGTVKLKINQLYQDLTLRALIEIQHQQPVAFSPWKPTYPDHADEEVTHLEEAALFKTSDKGNVIVLDIFRAKGLSMSVSNRITDMQSWLDVVCDNKEAGLPGRRLNLRTNLMRSLALGNKINVSGSSQNTPKFKERRFLKLGGDMFGLWPVNLECLARLAVYHGLVFKDGHVLLI